MCSTAYCDMFCVRWKQLHIEGPIYQKKISSQFYSLSICENFWELLIIYDVVNYTES